MGDIVAVLAREVGLDRSLIGRVDLRDAFTLVEVPQSEAERVALKLVGLTVRKRKLSARVDRGPSAPTGGSRGGGGGVWSIVMSSARAAVAAKAMKEVAKMRLAFISIS